MTRANKISLTFFSLLLIAVQAIYIADTILDGTPIIHSDGAANLELAYSLAKYDRFERLLNPGQPYIHRTPLYPYILSYLISINGIEEMEDKAFKSYFQTINAPFPELLSLNVLLHILTTLLACLLVWKFSSSIYAVILTYLLVGYDADLLHITTVFYTESLSAVLILLLALSLFHLPEAKPQAFVLPGILVGLLALCRGIEFYLLPIYALIILMTLGIQKTRRSWLTGLLAGSLFVFLAVLVISPWLSRNENLTGRFHLSNRGGNVLLKRAAYNDMTTREYLSAFFYWSGSPTLFTLLENFGDPKDYSRLVRSRKPTDAYWYGAVQELEKINAAATERYGVDESLAGIKVEVAEDAESKRLAISRILQNPFKHVLVSVPILFKGLPLGNLLRLFGFFSLIALSLLHARRRQWNVVVAFSPALLSLIFYSLFSHYIPRYTYPVAPLLTVALVLVVHHLVRSTSLPGSNIQKIV